MKRVISFILFTILIAVTAFAVIYYGKGYRLDIHQKSVSPTGILSTSSYPDKSSLWLDGKLISATGNSVNLTPNWYNVKITKEGYQSWEKRVRVQGEVVTQVDALLIPVNPSLRAVTVNGISNPILSPGGTKVAFIVPEFDATQSSDIKSKEGIWVMDLKNGPLGGRSIPRQIFEPKSILDWQNARLVWSVDEKQLLLSFTKKDKKTEILQSAYVLQTEGNGNTNPLDVTLTYQTTMNEWNRNRDEKFKLQSATLPLSFKKFMDTKSANIIFSPDETKIMYQATGSAELVPVITPPLIGSNPTEEARKIEPGKYYIYDTKEDKNFFLADSKTIANSQDLMWFSDSKHIITVEKDTIYITDYDGTNKRSVYAGPFVESAVFPWPAGERLIILTNLNDPKSLPNLYELDLR